MSRTFPSSAVGHYYLPYPHEEAYDSFVRVTPTGTYHVALRGPDDGALYRIVAEVADAAVADALLAAARRSAAAQVPRLGADR